TGTLIGTDADPATGTPPGKRPADPLDRKCVSQLLGRAGDLSRQLWVGCVDDEVRCFLPGTTRRCTNHQHERVHCSHPCTTGWKGGTDVADTNMQLQCRADPGLNNAADIATRWGIGDSSQRAGRNRMRGRVEKISTGHPPATIAAISGMNGADPSYGTGAGAGAAEDVG